MKPLRNGEAYTYEFQRQCNKERSAIVKAIADEQMQKKQELVDKGLARFVKIPIEKGYILHFEML